MDLPAHSTSLNMKKGRSPYPQRVSKDPGPMVQAPAVGRRWDTAGYVLRTLHRLPWIQTQYEALI
jgi:hypothetical protein